MKGIPRRLSSMAGITVTLSMALLALLMGAHTAPVAAHAVRHAPKHVAAKDIRCPKGHSHPTGSAIFSDVQFPDTVNPDQAVLAAEVTEPVFDGIVGYNNKDQFFPDMITQIPTVKNGGISKDGKTYTIHLKKGMVWSNGAPITSPGWKLGWAIDKDNLSGPVCLAYDCETTRVDTPDKYTAVFHLKHPDAAFLTAGHYPEIWPTSFSNPVCGWNNNAHDAANCLYQNPGFNFESTDYPFSGPYLVSNVVNDNRVEFVPNPKYNILNCGPAIKDLRFSFYSDNSAMIAAAASHLTDVTQDYTLQYRSALLSHKTYKTLIRPSYTLEHLELNHDPTYNGARNPIADTNVRIALALAMNKAQILASALQVSPRVASQFVGSSPLINTPTFRQPFADPKVNGQWDPLANHGKGSYVKSGTETAIADARKLLAKAGYASGFKVDFQTTTRSATHLAEQAAICQNWAAINVSCNALQTPIGKFFAPWDEGGTLYRGLFQVALFALPGETDPEGYRTSMVSAFIDREKSVHSTINSNFSAIKDRIIDTTMNVADHTTTNTVRKMEYSRWQVEFVKQAHWIVLYHPPAIATTDGHVKNVTEPDNLTGPEWDTWNWKLR